MTASQTRASKPFPDPGREALAFPAWLAEQSNYERGIAADQSAPPWPTNRTSRGYHVGRAEAFEEVAARLKDGLLRELQTTEEVYDDVKQALDVLVGVEMQGRPLDPEGARMIGRTLADVTEHLRAERGYADEKWQESELQTAISNWEQRATKAEDERDQLREVLDEAVDRLRRIDAALAHPKMDGSGVAEAREIARLPRGHMYGPAKDENAEGNYPLDGGTLSRPAEQDEGSGDDEPPLPEPPR
jgi:hypothetical protein